MNAISCSDFSKIVGSNPFSSCFLSFLFVCVCVEGGTLNCQFCKNV
ncbi:hypothetical protein NC652_011203 [Populus alba x Populus x berolinensis]|nr:hypothetical protein NC652_011203 [Populus alba x Populus x berolinensis]